MDLGTPTPALTEARRRIGVFGGTFDPIHFGHLFIAEEAADSLGLERVVFVPTGPAHHLRREGPIAQPRDRSAMVAAAISDNPRFELCTLEAEREEPSFTVETLRELAKRWDGAALYFIVGSDSLDDLPRWHHPGGILSLARVVAMVRGGRPEPNVDAIERSVPAARGRITTIRSLGLEISATDIRSRVGDGRSARYLLPEAVLAYIEQRRLYQKPA